MSKRSKPSASSAGEASHGRQFFEDDAVDSSEQKLRKKIRKIVSSF
jgi:hypothetical protein